MIVSKKVIQEVINEAAKTGCDYVELFIEENVSNRMSVIGGECDTASQDREQGAGLRLALKEKSVYGCTNKLDKASLIKLAQDLSQSFNEAPKEVTPLKALKKGKKHQVVRRPEDVSNEEKLALLMKGYNAAREYSKEISQASASVSDVTQKVIIAKMDGRFVQDERVYTRVRVSAVASDSNEQGSGGVSPGRAMGYELFDSIVDMEELGKEAARQAIVNLHADYAPSGQMPVVIDNGFGGVIFHEACGHSLEATSVAKGASVFCNKLGEQIANKCVSAVDDGTLINEWGSENFDDEANPQKKRVLIKNGILKSYMIDEINGRRMGMENTGSGRRESYKYAPTSRMSNTYICPGNASFEELFEGIEFGLYCKSLGGGSVSPATGDFNFAVNEGYIIRNGKIAEPVKGATLIGNGAQIIKDIVMVGKDLKLAEGMCGSLSGSIPVDVGQPPIRVSNITVGGRKEMGGSK